MKLALGQQAPREAIHKVITSALRSKENSHTSHKRTAPDIHPWTRGSTQEQPHQNSKLLRMYMCSVCFFRKSAHGFSKVPQLPPFPLFPSHMSSAQEGWHERYSCGPDQHLASHDAWPPDTAGDWGPD
eukprot:1142138-Pelagomonas_calceolata.AAC.2